MSLPSIAVVGGGVIGRTSALELARAGHAVTLIADRDFDDIVSSRAGALWFPFASAPKDRVLDWAARTLPRLEALVDDPEAGVRLVAGAEYFRTPDPDVDWLASVPGAELDESPADAPEGVVAIARATVPCVDMSRYLPWLRRQGQAHGVVEARRTIASIEEAAEWGDLVVLATGIRSGELVPDAGMYPIQGQIVRVANPGGIPWLEDASNPAGTTYVIPRVDDVVVGGTAVHGEWGLEPDPEVEAAMLARAVALVPSLAGQPVTSRAVGLRPGRAEVRLERVGDVIHCYGHGGSGVTLSYGCAEDVAALARR